MPFPKIVGIPIWRMVIGYLLLGTSVGFCLRKSAQICQNLLGVVLKNWVDKKQYRITTPNTLTFTDNSLSLNAMSQDQKREAIIEAAMKRFAHFGVAKTTMTEIATDLSISKALLYYYFPDKVNILAAVVKQIASFNSHKYDGLLNNEPDPYVAMQQFLEIRTETIIKYHYILEYLKAFGPNSIPAELQPIFADLSLRELDRITSIIEKGRQAGIFSVPDARAAAELFHEYLEGYRYSYFVRNPNIFPDKKQFQSILKKEKKFSVIFLKGLTQISE